MLTDAIIDRHGENIPPEELCRILNKVCIPMAGQRITNLLAFEKGTLFNFEEIMIELKLCISLLFTPFHQHLNKLADKPEELAAIWLSLLAVVSQLLGKEVEDDGNDQKSIQSELIITTKELASEHLRHSVIVLITNKIIDGNNTNCDSRQDEISYLTWNAIGNIPFCKEMVAEWKETAVANNVDNIVTSFNNVETGSDSVTSTKDRVSA